MLIIWGHKYSYELIGPVHRACPACGYSPMSLYLAKKKFTLYWIPTFTTETNHAIGCDVCKKYWMISQAEALQFEQERNQPAYPMAPPPGTNVPSSFDTPLPPVIVPPTPQVGAPARCSSCGQALVPGMRYCSKCGAPVA